jgi:hypothetical protein
MPLAARRDSHARDVSGSHRPSYLARRVGFGSPGPYRDDVWKPGDAVEGHDAGGGDVRDVVGARSRSRSGCLSMASLVG